MEDELKSKAFKNSLIIAFLYVGLGTLTAMSVYPPLYGDWVDIALLVALPVSIIGMAVMYADRDGYLLVAIIQIIIFLLFWLILYRYLLKRYKRQMR